MTYQAISPLKVPGWPSKARISKSQINDLIFAGVFLGCCYTVVVHITYTAAGPLDDPNFGLENLMANAEGGPYKKISFGVLFLAAFLGSGWRNMVASISIPYFLAVVWCVASASWAVDPAISLRRSIAMVMILLAVASSIRGLGPTRTLNLLYFFLATIIIASFVSVGLSSIPLFSFAKHPANEADTSLVGAWRGVMLHKNVAGGVMTHAAIVFLHFGLNRKRLLDWALFAAALIFLVMTKSKTSIGLAGMVIFAGLVYRWIFQLSGKHAASNFMMLVCSILCSLFIFVIINLGQIQKFFQVPENLSGRVAIWTSLYRYIKGHFWLGSGYGSFWAIGYQSPIYAIATKPFVQQTGHSHSGYIEILLTIGFIGFILAMISLVVLPFYRMVMFDQSQVRLGAMCFSIWFFGFLQDFTEAQYFSADKESWLLVLIAVCLVHNAAMKKIRESHKANPLSPRVKAKGVSSLC